MTLSGIEPTTFRLVAQCLKHYSDIDAYSFNIHPFQVRISLRGPYMVLVINRSVRLYISNTPRTAERTFVNSGNWQFY